MPVFFQYEFSDSTKMAVWHIQEEEDFFLNGTALQRTITHPHKRLQHLAGRYLLSYLFPDFPQEEILIASTRKPYLKDDTFHFSVSHCGDYAAAIVSKDYRVGVDIELYQNKVLKVRDKFLNEREKELIKNEENNLSFITTLWSAKESVFKWWSYGGVDFGRNILFDNFSHQKEGIIEGRFVKDDFSKELEIHYRLFDEFSLTYVISNGLP